jgi:hypothetical protein
MSNIGQAYTPPMTLRRRSSYRMFTDRVKSSFPPIFSKTANIMLTQQGDPQPREQRWSATGTASRRNGHMYTPSGGLSNRPSHQLYPSRRSNDQASGKCLKASSKAGSGTHKNQMRRYCVIHGTRDTKPNRGSSRTSENRIFQQYHRSGRR